MVRLVFRPYTQVRKAICTSAHLRASTRVSSGFALLRHSSPSFGSQQTCSHSNLSQKIMVGRWCRHRPSHQSGYLRFMGLPPTSSHACYTPWSVFQDGQIGSLPPASSGRSSRGTLRAPFHPRSHGRHRRRIERRVSPARLTDADQPPAHTADRQAGISLGAPAASNPFPLNNFKHFLTLFSKFFSSFPRGTCSLSVSRPYLALDGIYHLLWAAFPNNPTLRKRLVEWPRRRRRGSHPLGHPLPGDLGGARHRGHFSRLQFAGCEPEISKLGSSRFARRY